MEDPSTQLKQYIDDKLIEVYRASVEYFDSTDLVLVFDESKEFDPIDSYERLSLAERPNIPDVLKKKLCKPAKQAVGQLKYAEVAFWFVVFLRNGESACTAVKATLMGKAGNA